MRALLAIAMFVGGLVALNVPTLAASKYKRGVKPPCYTVPPRLVRGANSACVRGAWRYNPYDPIGEFRGFPGWARKAFSEGRK
jgi:hypothetical protein